MKLAPIALLGFVLLISGCSSGGADTANMTDAEKEKMVQQMIQDHGGPAVDNSSVADLENDFNKANEIRANCLLGTVSGAACTNADRAVENVLKAGGPK